MADDPIATTTSATTINPSQASHTQPIQPSQSSSASPTHPETQPPASWTPADYRAALTHLSELQAQITALRPAIPTLLTPLMQPASSKEQMFAEVRKAAVGVDREMRSFREAFEGERTVEVLGRVGESRGLDLDGVGEGGEDGEGK